MCLYEIYIEFRISKYLSEAFPPENVLKEGSSLKLFSFNLAV
jgi:hypothetical protein